MRTVIATMGNGGERWRETSDVWLEVVLGELCLFYSHSASFEKVSKLSFIIFSNNALIDSCSMNDLVSSTNEGCLRGRRAGVDVGRQQRARCRVGAANGAPLELPTVNPSKIEPGLLTHMKESLLTGSVETMGCGSVYLKTL